MTNVIFPDNGIIFSRSRDNETFCQANDINNFTITRKQYFPN